MKKIISMFLAMMLVVSLASTAYVATPEKAGSFNDFTTMQSLVYQIGQECGINSRCILYFDRHNSL